MLYDIYYHGAGMDSNRPLPAKPAKGSRYARNTNGDGHIMVPVRGAWIEAKLHRSSEGGHTVTVPSMPGCISEGEDVSRAAKNITEAIKLYASR
jgi:hypothetical protein